MSRVTIYESGRDGRVEYSEGLRTISGYWEFGGNDVVAIVSMGAREEWQRAHHWAMSRRAEILRVIADEVIRQRAPSCRADIDEDGGTILLRQGEGSAAYAGEQARNAEKKQRAVDFVHRLRDVKTMFSTAVLVIALVVGGVLWLGQQALTVTAVSGTPVNESLRFGGGGQPEGIATLIQTTDPHLVETSGRGGNTTDTLSLLITPLDGSSPHLVKVVSGVSPNSTQLSRIMGSDGRTIWFDATGLYGVRLGNFALVTPDDLHAANPEIDARWWDDQRGMDIVDGRLHAINADRSAALNVDPETLKATPAKPRPSNARFERHDVGDVLKAGVPLAAGASVGFQKSETGNVIVSRQDAGGKKAWSTDTGLYHFSMKQVLPGDDVIALIGERPPIPNKLSEPLLVLVDTKTGKLTTHSLWR